MNKKKLEQIIHTQIPLSRAMGINVVRCSKMSGVQFSLPIAPNRNHKNTAFGGTLVAAQALACWALVMTILDNYKINAEVVVQSQTGEFYKPARKNFTVATDKISVFELKRFLNTLKRKKKARIQISSSVICEGMVVACYVGKYVAIYEPNL
jgi:thioesterase domain-containing protein